MNDEASSTLEFMRRGGRVRRFHTASLLKENPVGHHTFNLTSILYCCVPKARLTMDLLYAAHLHDIPECDTGDMPAPFKRKVVGLREQMDNAEAEALAEHGLELPDLSTDETRWLKLADSLDGAFQCLDEKRMGNKTMGIPFGNFMDYANALLDEGDDHADDAEFYNLVWYIGNEWGNV
jgi:5'-deoxynucleotidase YfbR-like HD superfamily hydrolase